MNDRRGYQLANGIAEDGNDSASVPRSCAHEGTVIEVRAGVNLPLAKQMGGATAKVRTLRRGRSRNVAQHPPAMR